MLRRLLKIASIVCLVLCVSLMGMWVRSYWWVDEYKFIPFGSVVLVVGSGVGRLLIDTRSLATVGSLNSTHVPVVDRASNLAFINQRWATFAGFGFANKTFPNAIMVPYWFVVVITGTLGFVSRPRVNFRFDLRILIIVTTILAAVMAIIAELHRPFGK